MALVRNPLTPIAINADYYSLLGRFRTETVDASVIDPVMLQKSSEWREAYAVLSDPEKRKAYDASLDAYFQEMYQAVKKKDFKGLQALIGASGAGAAELEQARKYHLGFRVTDQKARSVVECLCAEKDTASVEYLVERFRPYFADYELALMGVELTPQEIKTSPIELIDQYARGNYPQRVDQVIALFPDRNLSLNALQSYMVHGNPIEAEKMATIAFQKKASPASFLLGFYQGDYLKDPDKLVRFLAAASPEFSNHVVETIKDFPYKTPSGDPISAAEQAVQKKLPEYAEQAKKLRKEKPKPFQGEGSGAKTNNAIPPEDEEEDGDEKDLTPPKVLSAEELTLTKEFTKIFDEAIQSAKAISAQDKPAKKDFVAALGALKAKTISDCLAKKFKDPKEDPMVIAKATQTLVEDIQNPQKRNTAVATFEKTTQPYKTTWDWKMILGAVIGFAIGFIIGAFIGAAAAPAAAFTALAVGAAGAWIGASLFGATAALACSAIGVKLAHDQDPVRQTMDSARAMRSSLN